MLGDGGLAATLLPNDGGGGIADAARVFLVLMWAPDDGLGHVGSKVVLAVVAALEPQAGKDEGGEADDEDNDHDDPLVVTGPPGEKC